MSKDSFSGKPPVGIAPTEQLRFFASLCRDRVDPTIHKTFTDKVQELGLNFLDDELTIIAVLDTPAKVQEFLNIQIYYNWDHAVEENVEETAMPPRQVLQTAKAHCFEGAMFAYAVNYLHGHHPKLVLLEASQDSEHNLVVVQDPQTKMYGANAHSAFPHLDGRSAEFKTIRALGESYYPYYYSDRTFDTNDLTLVGYSEPFDLVQKFGTSWLATMEPLWDIYYTYIDDAIEFHYLFNVTEKTHLYPLIRALNDKWIQIDGHRKAFVSEKHLPEEVRTLWYDFWKEHRAEDSRPQGKAKEIERQFQKSTGTTPLDLMENTDELQTFLNRGYRIDQLVKE